MASEVVQELYVVLLRRAEGEVDKAYLQKKIQSLQMQEVFLLGKMLYRDELETPHQSADQWKEYFVCRVCI